MDITIRSAVAADAPVILAMAGELAAAVADPAPPLAPADLVRTGFGAESWFEAFLAERAGQPVGYALISRGFEAHTRRRRLWIGDFFVAQAARRLGIGRRLIAAVAQRALALECDAVVWELWRPNRMGRAFFERLSAEEASDLAILKLGRKRLEALAHAPA